MQEPVPGPNAFKYNGKTIAMYPRCGLSHVNILLLAEYRTSCEDGMLRLAYDSSTTFHILHATIIAGGRSTI